MYVFGLVLLILHTLNIIVAEVITLYVVIKLVPDIHEASLSKLRNVLALQAESAIYILV